MTTPDPPARPRVAALRRYLAAPDLTARDAAAKLGLVHAAAFAAQVLAAGGVVAAVVTLAGRQDAPSGVVAATLLTASYLHLAIGVAAAVGGTQAAARTAARWRDGAPHRADAPADPSTADGPTLTTVRRAGLSAALLGGLLLAVPAWFLAFAWATGQGAGTLVGTAAALALGYALGLLQVRRIGRAVTPEPPEGAPGGGAERTSGPDDDATGAA
ncbi:MAG: hypothetical protein RI554_00360 [Trueperaceae bacterium]|nr:hypothetical protein [Trueperaceae bacterium]